MKKQKLKFLGWVCPCCFKINKVIERVYQEFGVYRINTDFNEEDVTDEFQNWLDKELIRIDFLDCGCSTNNYNSEELEVWSDKNNKVIISEFFDYLGKDEAREFLKKNRLEGLKVNTSFRI